MRVVVSTGEASGRLLASRIEVALGRCVPDLELLRFDVTSVQGHLAGFPEKLGSVSAAVRELGETARNYAALRPDLVLLCGFSNYNMLLGRRCRRQGMRSVFLAPPQLWAWGSWRLGALRASADLVISSFPFEAAWLRRRGVQVQFLGNPLAEGVGRGSTRAETLGRLGLKADERYIVFLPGSRQSELDYHVPVFEAVEISGFRCVVVQLDEGGGPAECLGLAARRYDTIGYADAAVVVSGTASLETALLGVPQVACYHLAPLTRLAARLLVRKRCFALPNVLLGCDSVRELLDPTPAAVVRYLAPILADPVRARRARESADRLLELLMPNGSTDRVARSLVRLAARPML